jgi:drug/metabolite transporter (DMT)-like permease
MNDVSTNGSTTVESRRFALTSYFSAAVAAILWGANFNLVKPVVAEIPPLIAGADRFLISAAIMLVITYATGQRMSWTHIGRYTVLGLFGVVGFNVFFFFGMASTSPTNGALIMALNPLLTSLIAGWVLGDRPTRRQWIAFPIGLIGVAIVTLGAGADLKISHGDIFLLFANLSWALYNVFVRKLATDGSSNLVNATGTMVTGAVVLTAVALLAGERFNVPSTHAGSALLAMSVGGGVLSYLLWTVGITRLGPARTAIFMNLVPVAAMAIATISGAPPNHAQLLGGALVIGAVVFSALR